MSVCCEQIKFSAQNESIVVVFLSSIRLRATALHRKWERFIEQDRLSQVRNDRLLQELNRIDVQAAILASRSEQLKVLKVICSWLFQIFVTFFFYFHALHQPITKHFLCIV